MKHLFIFTFATIFCYSCTQDPVSTTARLDNKLYPYLDRHIERAYPDDQPDVEAYMAAKEKVYADINNKDKSSGFDLEWQTEGPSNLGGRVTCITINPENDDIIYMGFGTGGAYKTIDGGDTWFPIFDNFPFLSVGGITIDSENTDIIYLGTGDPVISSIPHLGNGLYKSLDAGETWTKSGLDAQRIISKVEIDPTNPNKIFATSQGLPFTANNSRGIYLSEDAGSTWEVVYNFSDTTGFTDITINPSNPNIIHAAAWDRTRSNKLNNVVGEGSGIHLSQDGGKTWTKNIPGLSQGLQCKAGVTVCNSQPEIVYVVYIDENRELEGLYKSVDFGLTFESIDHDLDPGVMNGFGWYFGKISVNPNNPDHLFLHSVRLYESRDGGRTWDLGATIGFVHADMHGLQFSGDFIFLATDGGAYKRHIDDDLNGWEDFEDIPVSLFYRVAYNPHKPDLYYGGMQDNGTSAGNFSDMAWPRLFGGDGFQAVFNPNDPNHYFYETQNGGLNVTVNDGFNFDFGAIGINDGRKAWDMQYIMSPHDENIMYTATDRVYRTTNSYEPVWSSISESLTKDVLVGNRSPNATSISESPIDQGVLYVSFNEGSVYMSPSGGDEWINITEGLPERFVSSIKASPDQPASAYVTFSGFKDDDNTAYVFKTENYGDTWEDITSDLPNIAVNDILIIPNTNDELMFIASDVGVYGSEDGGTTWSRVGSNMPMVIVYDLEFNPVTQTLMAATFGKSIMSFPLDEQLGSSSTSVVQNSTITIAPSPASSYISILDNDLGENLSYELVDITGKALTNRVPLSSGSVIDVTNVQAGLNYIRLFHKDKIVIRSFIKG